MVTIEVTTEEKETLVKMLEDRLAETKIEFRRTRNPEWRDQLQREEDMICSLLERLTGAPVG